MFILKTKYFCETCGEEFNTEKGCIRHEKECDPIEYHTCTKCGESKSWTKRNDGQGHYIEGWHKIYLGRQGYGSNLDGSDVNFELCDQCLCEYIETFIHKEDIYNSGSNSYYDPDDCFDDYQEDNNNESKEE